MVITRGRREALRAVLPRHRASLPQENRGEGAWYVDNASSDGTAEMVRSQWPEAKVIRLRANIGAAARNVGVAWARTRYAAFSDDDSWWRPGALEAASDFLDSTPTVALVTGSTLVGPEGRPDPMNRALAESPAPSGVSGISALGFLACAVVVRSEVFLGSGGFPLPFGVGGEEEILALDLLSAGWEVVYRPGLLVHHHPGVSASRPARRATMARNAALTQLARRRGAGLLRTPRRMLSAGGSLGDAARGLVRAAALLPWIVSNRRPVPPWVEGAVRLGESRK